jgi:hypothetical protein
MAISYVGGKGAGSAGQGGGSISLTTGLTGGSGGAPLEGDLVVVTVSVGTQARQPTIAISTPSGYTPLTAQRTTATTYDTNVQTCYKVMGSTPDTSVTIPASGNIADGISYVIQVFRGVDTANPMDVTPTYATGSGVTAAPDPAAITPTTAGAWIVCCGGAAANAGGTMTASYLTNFLAYNGADTNDALIGCGYYTGWTSGSYDPAQFTGFANANNSWGATTLALRPAGGTSHATSGALVGQGAAVAGSAQHNIPHATTGALAGQGAQVVGSADRAAGTVTHDTSGALVGHGAAISGAAARFRAFAATGVLDGQGAAFSGSAARTRQHDAAGALAGSGAAVSGIAQHNLFHPTTGAIVGAGAAVAGLAFRFRAMASTGALAGQGAEVAGSASRSSGPVTHPTAGAIVGPGAEVVGSAARARLHDSSGALVGAGAAIDGAAARTRQHLTAGELVAAGSIIVGSAARLGVAITHDTSGALVGAAAALLGTAVNGIPAPEDDTRPRPGWRSGSGFARPMPPVSTPVEEDEALLLALLL